MRRAAKIDDNQTAIVEALRAAGCSVVSLAAVGKGCPDIACGRQGRTFLLEIKDGGKPPSARKLTAEQRYFHSIWKGHAVVVTDVAEAFEACGL
jgi:Holliday junction resolvase